jgi:hypothetical protein
VNRTREKAHSLVAQLGGQVGSLDDAYDLLVNATSVGMSPDVDGTPAPSAALRSGATVFDTVYRPLETRLLREARARVCRTQDGLDDASTPSGGTDPDLERKRADPALLRRAALRGDIELATRRTL